MTKVLVVDDDTDLLEMVSLVLTRHDMAVNPLAQCLQFFDTVSTDKPDIVLMDIYLGDCDGRNLCQNLKKSDIYADIPVILYSAGNVTQSSVHESLADDFMSKPFDIQQLVNRIRHHLGSGKQ
jgi:DNA-binding response OmpR family regulator